jgi:hypothetical protein
MNKEKSKTEEKNINKISNNKYMEDITTIGLIENSKRPLNRWSDKKNQFKRNIYTFDSKKSKSNLGIPTGKINNITVVDLDFYSKGDEVFDLENSSFIKAFGNDYIKDFDTFTVKTPSGGLHLYFKYDDTIGQTANAEHQVDTRTDGGYVVSPNSVINGNKYDIIHDTYYKEIPQNLKDYLLNVILNSSIKPKKIKKKRKEINNTNDKEIEVIEDEGYFHLDKYTYNFNDKTLIEIIEGLPEKYFNTYQYWLIFTTAMKQINRKDLWIKYSKKSTSYNEESNNKQWEGIKRHKQYNCLSNLLLNTKKNSRAMLEYYMYIDYDVHESKPDLIINQDKLTDENYSDHLNKKSFGKDFSKSYDCLIMKSDTGTGKTTSFRKYYFKEFESNRRTKFLSIVSRVSLAQEQYITFCKNGVDCRLYKNIDGKLKVGDNYIITIDSILKVANWDKFRYEDYIIYLDEFNSMIEYLICADTLNNKRVVVFNALLRILNNCKKIICTDADINDISLSFLKLVDKNKIYIENTFLHNKNIKSQEIFTYQNFCEQLSLEKKFLCCCDSKIQAEMIYQEMIRYGQRDVKLITSDNDEYINLDNYDKIIYSPKIVYGLDSSIKRPVYCYYKERTIAPTAMIQQIARCRNIKYLRYIFEIKKVNIYDEDFSLDYVKEELQQLETFGNDFCSFELMCNDFICDAYLQLYTKFTYLNNCYQTNKFGHFIHLLESRGFVNESPKYNNTSLHGALIMRKKVKENKIKDFSPEQPSVMKINEYLKIDTNENIELYKHHFLDQSKLDAHFNISTYFFNNFEDTKSKLFNQQEFCVKKIASSKSKIKFLQEIKDLTGCSNVNDIIVKKPLDIKNADFYATNYNKVWNASIKKQNIDFTNKDVLTQYIYKMYKTLFGNELVINKKVMINKERITQYMFNDEILKRERTLYDFRFNAKNKCD